MNLQLSHRLHDGCISVLEFPWICPKLTFLCLYIFRLTICKLQTPLWHLCVKEKPALKILYIPYFSFVKIVVIRNVCAAPKYTPGKDFEANSGASIYVKFYATLTPHRILSAFRPLLTKPQLHWCLPPVNSTVSSTHLEVHTVPKISCK